MRENVQPEGKSKRLRTSEEDGVLLVGGATGDPEPSDQSSSTSIEGSQFNSDVKTCELTQEGGKLNIQVVGADLRQSKVNPEASKTNPSDHMKVKMRQNTMTSYLKSDITSPNTEQCQFYSDDHRDITT